MKRITRRSEALAGEGGSSLIEVLLSATLIGIAFASIFGALSTAAISAKKNNEDVQVEVAITTAKQTVNQAAFDPTGAYAGVLPGSINGVATSMTVSGDPTFGLATLQKITITGTLDTITRQVSVYKGNR